MDGISTIGNFFGTQVNNTDSDVIMVGYPDALEKFYNKVAKFYSLDELKEILDCDDNLLIISGAGSGKTTTLLLKILRDILSGKLLTTVNINGSEVLYLRRILVCTFLRSGAEDLIKKFDDMCKRFNIKGVTSKSLTIKTIHAEVYNALEKMGVSIKLVQNDDLRTYIREVCNFYHIKPVMRNGSKALTKDDISDISNIINYARNRLDNSRYTHPLMLEYNISKVVLQSMIERFNLLKKVAGVKDFEDLEEQLYDGYQNYPKVLEFVKNRYDYIYVDEFQDTSQLQYAILEPYFRSAKGFLCIGDDDQCIYGWRGSDVKLIQSKFEKDFSPVVKQLTLNRRCSENILNAVIPSIEMNTGRRDKNLKASNPGGEVEVIVDGGVKHLISILKEDLTKGYKVGILGRTKNDLLIPIILLLIEGIDNFSISNSLSLRDNPMKQIFGLMDLITNRYTDEFVNYFKLFLNKSNTYEAAKLCEILSTSPEYSIFNIPLEDIRHSAPNLFYIIRMLREDVKVDPVKAYVHLLEIVERDVYNGKTIYAQRMRDFVYYVRKIIQEHESLKGKTLVELNHLFTSVLPAMLDARKTSSFVRKRNEITGKWETEFVPDDKTFIRVSTVHDAKGKEWDSVYIWNDVNGCFPNTVGKRELSDEEKEEERRVHYIAWTRPKYKLVVFTRSDRADGFLKECDLSNAKIIEMNERSNRSQNITGLVAKKEVFRKKEIETLNTEKSVEDILKEYVQKYTGYQYICTDKGIRLDMCLSYLGGFQKMVEYFKKENFDKYPKEERNKEDLINSILESLCVNIK